MGEKPSTRLRRLAAELQAETQRIARTVQELAEAKAALTAARPARLAVYGAAALLDTFYTGVEKALLRVAASTGDVTQGPSWHRALLESMALDIAQVRPPVLSAASVRALEPMLSFRHRFRNLYLFDLQPVLIASLVDSVTAAWKVAAEDLTAFAARITEIAAELERGEAD